MREVITFRLPVRAARGLLRLSLRFLLLSRLYPRRHSLAAVHETEL